MGTCNTTKNRTNKDRRSPDDTDTKTSEENKNFTNFIKQFGNQVIPITPISEPLRFDLKIFNLKGKMLPDNRYYIMKVIFANEKNTFVLPIISGTHPKFNFEKQLTLDIHFEKLDSTYFELHLHSLPKTVDLMKFASVDEALSKASLFSMVKVDLLTIAIGPEHHDICLLDVKRPHGIVGRTSFNIICSHFERINLNVKNLQCKVFHLVQNEVVFKLKFKESHNIVESEYTDALLPNLLAKEEVTLYSWIRPECREINNEDINGVINNSKNNPTYLSFNLALSLHELLSSNASINIYDVIFIDKSESDKDMASNVQLVRLSTMHLTKKLNIEEDNLQGLQSLKDNIHLTPKFTQIGYANLNFYKLFSENDNIITKQSSRFFQTFFRGNESSTNGTFPQDMGPIKFQVFGQISKQFTEDIYFQGNIIGKMDGNVDVDMIPLIRQIMCGVHTEYGFDISSVNLNMNSKMSLTSYTNSYTEDKTPAELKILTSQTNALLSNLMKGTNLTQFTQSFREINKQILDIMNELKGVLQKSFKESCLYYNYKHNKDLYKAQKIMLELGINILKTIETFNIEQRAIGFEILILINNRAEFDLGTVWRAWFADQGSTSIIRDSVLITDKIIEDFILFDNLCLEFVLDRLSKGKLADKESRVFVEFFLSVAYFRIPKFRKTFLEVISKDLYTDKKSYQELDKGTNSIEDFLNLDPINSLILWDVLFYKRLESALKVLEETNNLDNEIYDRLKDTDSVIIKDADWKERIAKKGGAFYSMIIKLEKYIQYKVVKNMDIKWYNIHGFDIIIDAICKELQTKEVTAYPAQLVELLTLFINDSDIINNFARLIMHKTKVYDTNAVFTVVKIVDAFFSEYEKKKSVSSLNIRFDYRLLKEAFRVMIEIDHSLSVAKFLWLYYRNSHIMSFEHIAEVFLKIFDTRFFNVFFHWSWQVRNVFYFIILFIINFRIRNLNFGSVVEDFGNKGIRRASIDMLKGVTNYPETLKTALLKAYSEKMKVIEKIKHVIHEESLDPTFNNTFRSINNPEYKEIPREVSKNIVVAMHHYVTIEKEFLKWEEENKRKKFPDIKYPVIDLEPPKDNVIQYSSENW